jgi:two-component system sensor histidine kinase AtoS
MQNQTLLAGIATQSVTAIENSRLFQDLREYRERVGQAEQRGTLSALSAVLAREIQGALDSVRGFLVTAPGKRADEDREFWVDQRERSLRDEEQIRQLAGTIERLEGGSGTDMRVPCDLLELVRRAVAEVSCEFEPAREAISIEADPQTPKAVAVQRQLHQVVVSLLRNAIEASPPERAIQVRLAPDPFGERPGIALEVSDEGCGISPEDLERIFDPFFTTKGSQQGLGLALCQHFVGHHGGSIEVRSEAGEGATFCVRLPAAPSAGS